MVKQNLSTSADWINDPDFESDFMKLVPGKNVLHFEDDGMLDESRFGKRVVFSMREGKTWSTKNRGLLSELKKLMPLKGKSVHIYRTGVGMSDTRYTEVREATAADRADRSSLPVPIVPNPMAGKIAVNPSLSAERKHELDVQDWVGKIDAHAAEKPKCLENEDWKAFV